MSDIPNAVDDEGCPLACPHLRDKTPERCGHRCPDHPDDFLPAPPARR